MKFNQNLMLHVKHVMNSEVSIDLDNMSIKFTDIFGKNIKASLKDDFNIFNYLTGRVTKGKFLITHFDGNTPGLRVMFCTKDNKGDTELKNFVRNQISLGNKTTKHYLNGWFTPKGKNYGEIGFDNESLITEFTDYIKINEFKSIMYFLNSRTLYKNKDGKFETDLGSMQLLYHTLNKGDNLVLKNMIVGSTRNGSNNSTVSFDISSTTLRYGYSPSFNTVVNLMNATNHMDCCGTKSISRHSFYSGGSACDDKQKETYLENRYGKYIDGDTSLQFIRTKLGLLGKAPWMIHVTDNQIFGTKFIYKKLLGKNTALKFLHRYKNPNSSNHISIFHLEIPYVDENGGEIQLENRYAFQLFLYFWFKKLERQRTGEKVYRLASLTCSAAARKRREDKEHALALEELQKNGNNIGFTVDVGDYDGDYGEEF